VEWNEDPHAIFVYKTIRDASIRALEAANNIEPRRPEETANELNLKKYFLFFFDV
jgi:hypothetical protein